MLKYVAHQATYYQAESFLSSGCSLHKQPLELRNDFLLFVLHAGCLKRFPDGVRLKHTLRTCVGPSVILFTFLKTFTLLNCTNSLTHVHYVHKHALVRISQEGRWGKVSFESQPIICVVIWKYLHVCTDCPCLPASTREWLNSGTPEGPGKLSRDV